MEEEDSDEMIILILKAVLTGICAAAPIGPIAFLVLQNSISGGHKAGFVSGLGSSVIDTLFFTVALFTISLVQDFIDGHRTVLLLVGGMMVALVGLWMWRRKNKLQEGHLPKSNGSPFQAALCTLANPGALAFMLAVSAIFGLNDCQAPAWAVILAVFCGSALYWFCFSYFAAKLRSSMRIENLKKINVIAGMVVCVIGLMMVVMSVFEFLK